MLYQVLLVGVGGFLGAVARFGVSQLIRAYLAHPFPFATLAVNIMGCAVIGALFEYFRGHQLLPTLTLFMAVGFLGSFTTFSAFGFETIQLVRDQELNLAMLNIGTNLILCLAAVQLGGRIAAHLT